MSREIFKFLSGAAAAACLGHLIYAAWTAAGWISVPIWHGREWGTGKMSAEALVFGALAGVLGYLGWRPVRREVTAPLRSHTAS